MTDEKRKRIQETSSAAKKVKTKPDVKAPAKQSEQSEPETKGKA